MLIPETDELEPRGLAQGLESVIRKKFVGDKETDSSVGRSVYCVSINIGVQNPELPSKKAEHGCMCLQS